jgi:hypothetical protein
MGDLWLLALDYWETPASVPNLISSYRPICRPVQGLMSRPGATLSHDDAIERSWACPIRYGARTRFSSGDTGMKNSAIYQAVDISGQHGACSSALPLQDRGSPRQNS